MYEIPDKIAILSKKGTARKSYGHCIVTRSKKNLVHFCKILAKKRMTSIWGNSK